jgi:hypothetical protein
VPKYYLVGTIPSTYLDKLRSVDVTRYYLGTRLGDWLSFA